MMSKKIYQAFSPELDFSGIDHIIIGSGIGGLTAATWLAKAGKKVAIFEYHNKPGGFTHSFKRKQGFQWDVGVHYVGNVSKEGSLRSLFDFLSNYKLDWESMGEVYDVVYIKDKAYEFKAGKESFKKQIISYFPDEAIAINNYLKLIDKANKMGNAFFFEKTFNPILSFTIGRIIRKLYARYSQKTTLEVMSKLTTNKRLISVLCAQCGNYGLSPKYSSFAAHALIVGHFMEGGYYPIGGAEQIANNILETINKFEGKVYINAEVDEIITEKNRVKGIRIKDKFIACNSVISNVGVNNTFNHLLSEKAKLRCNFNLHQVKPSIGHMCLYVGLDKSDIELKLPKHNIWRFDSDNFDNIIDNITLKNIAKNFAYISFPSAKDPAWAAKHPGKATIQALSVAQYNWFSEYTEQTCMKRDKTYMSLKKEFQDSMLKQLYELFPQIKGHVIVTEVSTPLSTKHFLKYQNGEIYGLAHTPDRFQLPFLRPKTKIKGLRLVGQDITLVGVAGAMLSGMLCVIPILKWRVWQLFREMAQRDKMTKKIN